MRHAIKTPCPGCGAAMVALSFRRDEVKLSEDEWELREAANLACRNGCQTTVARVNQGLTMKTLETVEPMPILAECVESFR